MLADAVPLHIAFRPARLCAGHGGCNLHKVHAIARDQTNEMWCGYRRAVLALGKFGVTKRLVFRHHKILPLCGIVHGRRRHVNSI